MAYHDFIEMPVWQKANEVVGDIYKLSQRLPKREDYALCSQIRDAAISIAANIAEGFGRGHIKEKVHFYYYSRGSCYEVRSHLRTGITAGYFSLEQIKIPEQKCLKVIEELNKLIKGLTLNSKP